MMMSLVERFRILAKRNVAQQLKRYSIISMGAFSSLKIKVWSFS